MRPSKDIVAVIGCGALGRIIVRGLQRAEGERTYEVLATQRSPERAVEVSQALGVVCKTDNRWACERSTIVLLAVRPQSMVDLLKEIASSLRPGTLCISVAAGLPLSAYETFLPPDVPIVRALPTPMMAVNRGFVAMAASPRAEPADVEKARRLFGLLCDEALLVPEHDLNLFAALHGSAAALLYLFVDALLSGGGRGDHPVFSPRRVVAAMLQGVAQVLIESNEPPHALSREICTPAGMTEAGVMVWERSRVSDVVSSAMDAVLLRAAQLGRNIK